MSALWLTHLVFPPFGIQGGQLGGGGRLGSRIVVTSR
jgi:hypothetical protein